VRGPAIVRNLFAGQVTCFRDPFLPLREKVPHKGDHFFVITTDFSDGSSLTILLSLALTARKLSIFTIQTSLHLSTTRCLFAPDELHDNQLLRVLLMKHRMFAQLRKSATVTEKPKKNR
jgi:hypothetical protein